MTQQTRDELQVCVLMLKVIAPFVPVGTHESPLGRGGLSHSVAADGPRTESRLEQLSLHVVITVWSPLSLAQCEPESRCLAEETPAPRGLHQSCRPVGMPGTCVCPLVVFVSPVTRQPVSPGLLENSPWPHTFLSPPDTKNTWNLVAGCPPDCV